MKSDFFVDRLIQRIKAKKSHVVVGLDPVYDSLPSTIINKIGSSPRNIGKGIFEFNKGIIDAVSDLVPAVKPQIAFYERYGLGGIKAFLRTVHYAQKKGLIVIADVKRGDIGSTAVAYSDAYLGQVTAGNRTFKVFSADALTVNPYVGTDGIMPFIKDAKNFAKGIFVLVKTSNPSSVELQDLVVQSGGYERKLYETVALLVDKWGQDIIGESNYSSVGAVVGATYPQDAQRLRSLMPRAYFLVPGYGAQGGTASDVVHCFNEDGLGAVINASRSINYAFREGGFGDENFGRAAREAVIRMNYEINEELKTKRVLPW